MAETEHRVDIKVSVLGFAEGPEREWAMGHLPDFIRDSPALDLSRTTVSIGWVFADRATAWEQVDKLRAGFGEHLHDVRVAACFDDEKDEEDEDKEDEDEGEWLVCDDCGADVSEDLAEHRSLGRVLCPDCAEDDEEEP